jgi:N utilization substance protein B
MGSRRKARECALQLLYQLDLHKSDPKSAIASFWEQQDESVDDGTHEFSETLVAGVWENLSEIDELIARHSTNWKVSRMASVDKNILRLAIYELLYMSDVPFRVTLNEAVEIAKRFGTAESSAFVNGILDHVAREHASSKSQGESQ